MNYKNIKLEKRENYAIIEIANNKNNSLDQKTLNEIGDATKGLNKVKEIRCIGLIGSSKFFSPGADIKELEKLDSKKAKKQKLFSKVDDLQKIIFFLFESSNFEATIPIIIALSPAKTKSISMISINIISCSVIMKFISY